MVKCRLIDPVNEGIRDTQTRVQKNSAEAKKVGVGAHIKFLERKTKLSEKEINWIWHKSVIEEVGLMQRGRQETMMVCLTSAAAQEQGHLLQQNCQPGHPACTVVL